MKKTILLTIIIVATFIGRNAIAQSLYFPPITGTTWQTTDPTQLVWCQDSIASLINFLQQQNSKAFNVLKDGRIVIEHYFGTFTQDSVWYWASAGKSLSAFLVGRAQEEGFPSHPTALLMSVTFPQAFTSSTQMAARFGL